MKCYLHVGTEKTATTTIQNFLYLNRNKLRNNGYIYTESAGKVNNIRLCVAAYDLSRRDNLTKKLGLYSGESLSKFTSIVINEIKNELNDTADYSVIFSSEFFQSRLTKVSEIKRLKTILNELGINDISVVVYLRDPAEIANSLYSTDIKCGGILNSPPSPTNKYYANICNHQNTLKRFSSIFGKSSLIVKVFDKNEFKNASIVDDFLESIGILDGEIYDMPKNSNKSLSPLGIEILRRINQTIPKYIGDKKNPLRANIVSYLEKYFTDKKYLMSSDKFREYNQAFHESNEWVRQNYFPGRKTLFARTSYACYEDVAISDDVINNIANMMSEIWHDKQKRILHLTNDKI